MAEPPLKQGTIAFAMFVPERGEPKRRPVAVYTPDALIPASSKIGVVMISTSCYPDDSDCILLPYESNGRCSTRLKKPSALAMRENAVIPVKDVLATWGFVPDPQRAEMLAWLKRAGQL